jgi:hypothetical protein
MQQVPISILISTSVYLIVIFVADKYLDYMLYLTNQ